MSNARTDFAHFNDFCQGGPGIETKAFQTLEGCKAIIVGVLLPQDKPKDLEDNLDELAALLKTLGVEVGGRIVQKRQKLTSNCLIGTGKIDEIRDEASRIGAQMIVFDRQLSPPQIRNIEETTKCEVLDRAGVILDIFAKHARTNQARTQVEIARLEYLLPRMAGAWSHLQRQRGGGGGGAQRGMGEKQIEVDRRRARERIAKLRGQLGQIQREKDTQRKARQSELKVALVGYTNSGKTTLMNSLTHSDLQSKDALFATLDSTVRTIDPNTRPRILLSDTVGFIKNLPHGLIESFKSTLDEVLEADLLCVVVDTAHEKYREQMETTLTVLEEIGAKDIPILYVFNKIDQIQDDPHLGRVLKSAYKNSIAVSAYNPDDVKKLRDRIYSQFEFNFQRVRLAIPASDQPTISLLYRSSLVYDADYSFGSYVIIDANVTADTFGRVKQYKIAEDEEKYVTKHKTGAGRK